MQASQPVVGKLGTVSGFGMQASCQLSRRGSILNGYHLKIS